MLEPKDEGSEQEEASTQKPANSSKDKAFRTLLMAVCFHVSYPKRLTRNEIIQQIPAYGESPQKAFKRDLETLTNTSIKELPRPDDDNLEEWADQQIRHHLLPITHAKQEDTFALVRPSFLIDITEAEARAFVALRDGFTPGTPYFEAIQALLDRWEWSFSRQSHELVRQKRQRKARPIALPLSPVVDYSKHNQEILTLDAALEERAFVTFDYVTLERSWDDPPFWQTHVEPYELEYREGCWYFVGFREESQMFVDYRVDRIRPGTLVKEKDRFGPAINRKRGVKIRYRVSSMLARHNSMSARLQDQHMDLLPDDKGAIIEGYAKSLWWAKRLLLGYGEQVMALEPPELIKDMRETTQRMYQQYQEVE